MFRRLSEKSIRDMESGDRFARTANWVFFLSFILFPIFIAMSGRSEGETLEGAGFFYAIAWFLGLRLAVTMYIPAMVCGALVFFVLYKITSLLVGAWAGAIIAAPAAAYLSVLVSYHLDFDFFPPGLAWNSGSGAYSFSNSLGGLAAFLSVPVSAITWLGAKHGG